MIRLKWCAKVGSGMSWTELKLVCVVGVGNRAKLALAEVESGQSKLST